MSKLPVIPDIVEKPGQEMISPAERIGQRIKEQMKKDRRFYLFSPDETTSNKLDAAYDVTTRAWSLPKESWDMPESKNGRIIELLSENVLFAAMVGHIMNGEQAMMTSYESFFSIITSQLLQQIKFFDQCKNAPWRQEYPAINLLSTSTCWRQDHNGFTHQSPALISTLLSNPSNLVNCLFPVDDVSADAAVDFMIKSTNVVNLTTFNKTEQPRWIDKNHAKFQYENGGASVYGFVSDQDPDFIFTAAGDIASREIIYAIGILRNDLPDFKYRFVGINALSYNAIGTTNNKLDQQTFDNYFTQDKHIIAAFHGYPETLKHILANYADSGRITVHGFQENGSTTTPMEMLSKNDSTRYHFCIDVANMVGRPDLAEKYRNIIEENKAYARENGIDKIQEIL